MIPHDLPTYVETGGSQVWRPPYRARRVETFGFVLACERSAIDALLLRDLVEPAGGAVDYRCAQEWLIVLFAGIEHLSSAEEPDRLRGYAPELEVSIWCLAADVSAGGRLVWYLPYVFVDSGPAMASGREVYGYPKQLGAFGPNYPDALASPGTTTVQGMAIQPFGPNQEATLRPMISGTRLMGTGGSAGGGGAASFADLLSLLAEDLTVEDETIPFGPGPELSGAITPLDWPAPSASPSSIPAWAGRRVLDTFFGRSLATDDPNQLIGDMVDDPTLVFLKQFRDASCPSKACYQAIVEAQLAVKPGTASYQGLDPGLFEITIEEWDSHPIASDLGVAARTPLKPAGAFRAKLDFDILLGLEVWRAPT